MEDVLYNVYSTITTAKKLWESLEKKYKIENFSTKKFIVGRFLDFKMVDLIPVVKTLEEIQVIINQIILEGMSISEPFKIASIIEKLSPTWKEFMSYLKHKHKKLSKEDLAVRLRIEKDKCKGDKKGQQDSSEVKANLIEGESSKPTSKSKFKGGKQKSTYNGSKD